MNSIEDILSEEQICQLLEFEAQQKAEETHNGATEHKEENWIVMAYRSF